MKSFATATIALSIFTCVNAVWSQTSAPGEQSMDHAQWRLRRADFIKSMKDAQSGNANALRHVNEFLTDFDTKPLGRTPLENMEIVGAYYLPREGVEKCMPIIAMNAALGWYDALRFASESGRQEIFQNEALFKRAFVVAGRDAGAAAIKYGTEHPEEFSRLVEQGLIFADKNRDAPYDHRWPSIYGLEHSICAQGGTCASNTEMPHDQWDATWMQARARVKQYFIFAPMAAPGPAASK